MKVYRQSRLAEFIHLVRQHHPSVPFWILQMQTQIPLILIHIQLSQYKEIPYKSNAVRYVLQYRADNGQVFLTKQKLFQVLKEWELVVKHWI